MGPHLKPALGALLTGLVGVVLYYTLHQQQRVLAVLSFGYGALQEAMTTTPPADESLYWAVSLLAIALGKIVTTSLTIGSGGSGGVFGPSMVIGGCGSAALGVFLHRFWPGLVPHPASFAIVGMAGFFAAAAKTPFSTLVIVSEMTGGYNLLLPALWVCVLTFLLSDEQSIYHSQAESRSRSPAHQGDYVREVLAGLDVSRFLTRQQPVPVLHPEDTLETVLQRFDNSPYSALPVVSSEGSYLGMVSLDEVHAASRLPHLEPIVLAADLMREDVVPLRPHDRLDYALELFVENDLLELPVVDDTPQRRVVGIVQRKDLSSTYLRHVHGMRQETAKS
ncbi:H(+)/Cl(-) exchange transporter ClcA [bacterium HR36]|nr:H(+)/Cl(-) exchange transporter ClcA [bacterium HR36]